MLSEQPGFLPFPAAKRLEEKETQPRERRKIKYFLRKGSFAGNERLTTLHSTPSFCPSCVVRLRKRRVCVKNIKNFQASQKFNWTGMRRLHDFFSSSARIENAILSRPRRMKRMFNGTRRCLVLRQNMARASLQFFYLV